MSEIKRNEHLPQKPRIKALPQRIITRKLHQMNQLKQILEAQETKAKSIKFRKNLLERQQSANYRNEYDRLRGELQKSLTETEKANIDKRIELIKKWF